MSAATKKQPELTAAQLYEQAADEQFEKWLEDSFSSATLKGVPLYEHKLPQTGIVIKVRNLSNEFLVQSGAVPMGDISNAVLEEADDLTPEEQAKKAADEFEAMPAIEKLRRMKAVTRQMRYICVEPRLIVGEVNGHKNAISVSQLRGADFNSLAQRSNPMGGAAVSGLRTFRRTKKRR